MEIVVRMRNISNSYMIIDKYEGRNHMVDLNVDV